MSESKPSFSEPGYEPCIAPISGSSIQTSAPNSVSDPLRSISTEATSLMSPASLASPASTPGYSLRTKTVAKVGALQMIFIAYSFTAAGPFGLEAAVRSAGPLFTLLSLLILPVIYVVPQILIVAELATMIPSAHGAVLWVQRAYGDGVGYYSSMTNAAANLVDGAVYPTLFAGYIAAAFWPEATEWEKRGIGFAAILFGFVMAMMSARFVGYVSTLLSFAVMAPFVVGFFAGAKYIDWDRLSISRPIYADDHEYDWGLLISTLIWLFTGWRSLGNLGEEVEKPSVFTIGMPVALVLGMLSYFMPLLIAMSVPIPPGVTPWHSGYLATAFATVLPGLDKAIAVAGACGNIGLFASAMLVYPRTTWGIAERGWLPSILARRNPKTKSPYVAAIFHCLCACVLVMFDFSVLVRMETIIAAGNYILSATCLAVLRKKEPDTPRPFQIPKSFVGSIILVTVPSAVFVAVLLLNLRNWVVLVGGLAVNVVIIAAYNVRKYVYLPRVQGPPAPTDSVAPPSHSL